MGQPGAGTRTLGRPSNAKQTAKRTEPAPQKPDIGLSRPTAHNTVGKVSIEFRAQGVEFLRLITCVCRFQCKEAPSGGTTSSKSSGLECRSWRCVSGHSASLPSARTLPMCTHTGMESRRLAVLHEALWLTVNLVMTRKRSELSC